MPLRERLPLSPAALTTGISPFPFSRPSFLGPGIYGAAGGWGRKVFSREINAGSTCLWLK